MPPPQVDLAAPGVNMWSTWHTADDAYHVQSGTSAATGLVAGAAALLFSAAPDATWRDVK